MARTQTEINNVYFNLVNSAGILSNIHITGVINGEEMDSVGYELEQIFNIIFIFDNALGYLKEDTINSICDLAARFNYNQ